MKIFEVEINNLRIQILVAKNDVVSLQSSTLYEPQVLKELIFRYNFQFSIFLLQKYSEQCLIFSYFPAVVLGKFPPRKIAPQP